MSIQKINLRPLVCCIVLLISFLPLALQAQGWRRTMGTWGGGPYMPDGNKVVAMNPLPDGRTLSVVNNPNSEASYYFAVSWVSGPTGTRSIPFHHDKHYFCRDAFAETIDSIVLLEERLPVDNGKRQVYLSKYYHAPYESGNPDSTFHQLWAIPLLSDSTYNAFAHAFIQISDGYVALASREETQNNTLRDVVLMKTDRNGTVLWTRTFPTQDEDYGVELVAAADGGFFLLKTLAPTANPGAFRTILVKTDALGNLEWETDLTDGDSNQPFDLATTEDGNLLISGVNHSSGQDVFLIKAGQDGAVLWRKDLLMPQSVFSNASVMEDTHTHDIVMAASFRATDGQNSNVLLIKVTANGDPVWETNLTKPARNEFITTLVLRPDGGYGLGGYLDPTPNSPHALLYKTDANGVIKAGIIEGNAFDDLLPDCTYSPGEIPLQDWVVQAVGDNGFVFYGDTDASGNYRIECDTGGYLVRIFPIAPSYWEPCANPVSIHVGYLDTVQVDFPMEPVIICPYMTVDHTISQLRPCDTTTFYVHYCNEGTMPAQDVSVRMILDPVYTLLDSDIPATVNGDTLYFPVGEVGLGGCGDFSFTALVDCNAPQFSTACSEAHIYPDSICTDTLPFWSGAFIEASGFCDGDTVRFTLRNVGGQSTAAPLDYIVIEDAVLLMQNTYELGSGGTLDIPVTATGATYRLMAQQEPGAPGNSLPIAAVEGCTGESGNEPSYGFFDQFEQNEGDPFVSVGCWVVLNSFDPNDKQASPTGFDEEHYIFKDTDLDYRIRFQNTGSDTAFRVMVADTLSPFLNPATVRPGASSHPYTFEIEGNGVLRFTFQNIGLPHKAVDEEGSQGFVSFRVSQKANTQIGQVIENSAAIYFDYNAPVITNTTWHTLHEPWITIVTGSVETAVEKLRVKIYPNPMGNQATLELKEAGAGTHTLVLLDQTGREVVRQPFTGNTLSLERNGLAAGIYFFRIVNGHGQIATGKIVVQ